MNSEKEKEKRERASAEKNTKISGSEVTEKGVNSLKVSSPPAMFQILLKRNTNLNDPPSNWLHGSSRWQSHIHQASFPFDNLYSSFSMANRFLDLTGMVDVISDSKNIKKLLKMTLSKANVSMMVHRVNNTLLLDSFDIHSLLKQEAGIWELFRKFYYETVAEDVKLSVVERKNKSRDYLQSRNMLSKLLYYCMADEQTPPDSQSNQPNISEQSESDSNLLSHRTVVWNFEDIRMLIGTDLPIFGGDTHPCVSLKLRDMRKPINVLTGLDNWLDNLMCNVPELAMCYHDNGIVQSYELLKTEDIPNCPEGRFSPKVIKDIAQNILSFLKSNATKEGHTYWLFKAHDGDIVKLYDLTTLCCNIHNVDDSKTVGGHALNPFTLPVGILFYRLARNLRLRQRCPSKGKKVPIIKKLLRNCILLLEHSKHYQVVISCHYFMSDLLVCDHLEEASQSESSESDDDASTLAESSDEDVSEKKDSCLPEEATSFIKVQALNTHRKPQRKQSHPTVKRESSAAEKNEYGGEGDEFKKRSSKALKHMLHALESMDKFETSRRMDEPSSIANKSEFEWKKMSCFEEPAQCNPNEAIPLHYVPLNPACSSANVEGCAVPVEGFLQSGGEVCEKNYFVTKKLSNMESPFSNKGFNADHWVVNSKIFLFRKICVVFLKRAKTRLEKNHYSAGLALQDGMKAFQCYCALGNLIMGSSPSSGRARGRRDLARTILERCHCDPVLLSSILMTLGDVYLQGDLVDQSHGSQGSLPVDEETDQSIMCQVTSCISDEDLSYFNYPVNMVDSYNQSLLCYSVAQKITMEFELSQGPGYQDKPDAVINLSKPLHEVLRRKANAYNEFGKHLLNQITLPSGALNPDWSNLLKEVQKKYKNSVEIFNQLDDRVNAALVLANDCKAFMYRAKIIRKLAEADRQNEFSDEEKLAYKNAELSGLKALKLLENNKRNRDIYDVIKWDLVSVFVDAGGLTQDNPPLSRYSREAVKSEVVCWFEKALEHCKFDPSSSKFLPSQYRIAHIHHRLASFYHKYFLGEPNKQTCRKFIPLAERQYRLAYDVFVSMDAGCELIRLQLERFKLVENSFRGDPSDEFHLVTAMIDQLLLCSGPMKSVGDLLQDIFDKFFEPPPQLQATSSSSHALDVIEFNCEFNVISEAITLCSLVQLKLSFAILTLLKTHQKKHGDDEQLKKYKLVYHKCLTSCAGRLEWDLEKEFWENVSNKFTGLGSELSLLSRQEILSRLANSLLSTSAKFPKPQADLSVRLQLLLTAVRSLSTVLNDLKLDFTKFKSKK